MNKMENRKTIVINRQKQKLGFKKINKNDSP